MYQSFLHDQYSTYYCSNMTSGSDECDCSEFRARSQTWGGNGVGYRTRLDGVSPQPQYSCYDSFNSNDESIASPKGCNINDKTDRVLVVTKGNIVKKTSRKNPWGQETYADLIEGAIESYPLKMATLQQIYEYISKNYKYFSERSDAISSAGWKNSIRHNLSLHDKFLKCPKKNENMKSSLWSINENIFKRLRSNSVDCKKSGLELVTKRKLLKEKRRNSATNSNVFAETKRTTAMRSPKVEKICKVESFTIPCEPKKEPLVEKSSEFIEMDSEIKYMPPDIPPINNEYSLHKGLSKLEMTSMEPMYNYNFHDCRFDNREIPDFDIAAMEYSKFVAELFVDDLE